MEAHLPQPFSVEETVEQDRTRRLAERYRCPFIDLREQRVDPDLFRSIPAELMFRYNFVPL
jgi:type IV pilus assembly protein PilB